MKTKPEQIWTWEWVGGGYNSTRASTREEALAKATKMGELDPRGSRTVTLVPAERTLRAVTPEEMEAIDRSWSSMCD